MLEGYRQVPFVHGDMPKVFLALKVRELQQVGQRMGIQASIKSRTGLQMLLPRMLFEGASRIDKDDATAYQSGEEIA